MLMSYYIWRGAEYNKVCDILEKWLVPDLGEFIVKNYMHEYSDVDVYGPHNEEFHGRYNGILFLPCDCGCEDGMFSQFLRRKTRINPKYSWDSDSLPEYSSETELRTDSDTDICDELWENDKNKSKL